MILADSSVWIDYFRGEATVATDLLDDRLGRERILIGDLILAEVLQGFTTDRTFNLALSRLSLLDMVEIGGQEVAIAAARN